jgi:hypothetical protein
MQDDTDTSNADCATCERAAIAVAKRKSAFQFLSGLSLYKMSSVMIAPSAIVPSSHVASSHFQDRNKVHNDFDGLGWRLVFSSRVEIRGIGSSCTGEYSIA